MMTQIKIDSRTIKRFFKDKDGHWTIIQSPNVLLSAWIVLLLLNLFINYQPTRLLQSTVLFAWAYLELTQGTSNFRKLLGAIILTGVTVSFFI